VAGSPAREPLVGTADELSKWFGRPSDVLTDARCRLLCLPYAGGSSMMYRSWPAELAADRIEVRSVTLPGRADRWSEPLFHDLHLLADTLADLAGELTDLPIAIFGYSLGALVGFELTRRLNRIGHPPTVLIAAAHAAPSEPRLKRIVHLLPNDDFIAVLSELDATPRDILDNDEMLQVLLPMLRGDFALAETYRYQPDAVLSTPILTIAGQLDPEITSETVRGWRRETVAHRHVELAGGHLFIEAEQQQVLELIRDAVRRALGPDGPRQPAG
jgi:surfactin synthase thioesterase subunit